MTPQSARERYDVLRRQRPALFDNPAGASYVVLTDPDDVKSAEAQEADRLRRNGLPDSWCASGVVYEDAYLLVLRDAVRRPDGTLGTYVRTVSASPARGVAVLPLMGDEAILIRHFRHATRSTQLEIPRGFGEAGRTSAQQAAAELREEIGAQAIDLIDLGTIYPNTGISSDPVDLFLAHVREFGEPQQAEGISGIQVVPVPRLADMIASSAIADGFTIAAYVRATLRGYL